MCFPLSLSEGLRLDVRLVCLCYVPLCSQNGIGWVKTGKILDLTHIFGIFFVALFMQSSFRQWISLRFNVARAKAILS